MFKKMLLQDSKLFTKVKTAKRIEKLIHVLQDAKFMTVAVLRFEEESDLLRQLIESLEKRYLNQVDDISTYLKSNTSSILAQILIQEIPEEEP